MKEKLRDTEEWVEVPFKGSRYFISSHGRLKSYVKYADGRILSQVNRKDGYREVNLRLNGKRRSYLIHQLVAIGFLGHTPDRHKKVVDHIDNDPSNNNVDNLRVVTHRFNCSRGSEKNTSKYAGVSFHKNSNKWRAAIQVNGVREWLGNHDTEIDAHKAYQKRLSEIDASQSGVYNPK